MMESDGSKWLLDQRVDQLISAQVMRTPDALAVVAGGQSLTYRELEQRCDCVAAALRAQGVARGTLVGIHLERSLEMLVAVIAVMKAGGAYIPLDPDFPSDRLLHMVSDSGLPLIITEHALLDSAPAGKHRVLDIAQMLDFQAAQATSAEPQTGGNDLAYVLYTSGSTGLPKGVAIEHHSMVNFLLSMQREPGMTANDRLLAVTTLSFDIAGLELYLPLICGASLVIASRDEAMDGEALLGLIGTHHISIMQATPSTWRLLLEAGWEGAANFKALCGGEALPRDLGASLSGRCGELWNLYGPTETTVWSSLYRVRPEAVQVLIGTPIANTTIYILDKSGNPVPAGIPGEIFIGGAGVARGYLNRAELTAERFIADPFAASADARMYRTGDQGRYLVDGNLEYRSRLDSQVKIRGYRIELGEIEHTLLSIDGIRRAVVVPREDQPGDVRLAAYVVADAGVDTGREAISAHLRISLPHYMVPQHVIAVDAIPLLPNGKVDRKSLPAPALAVVNDLTDGPANGSRQEIEDPRTRYLAGIWTEILGMPAAPGDNFFDLGGHSMLAVQMANRVGKETGYKIKLIPLATQTLEQIAMALPKQEGVAPLQSNGSWLKGMVSRLFDSKRPG